MEKEFNP